jgi:hypothetical protein
MIPEKDLELYDLWLAVRENGQRGEPGTLHRLRDYAQHQGIALSTVYFPMKQLAQAIQRHPWFDEITRPFRPARTRSTTDYLAAFFLVGFVFEGLAFAVFFAALASAISANTFSIRRI